MVRSSGVFLPVSSLPSRYPIGDFGPSAYRFVDNLVESGQRVWAVLPLLLPDSVGSPYNSLSSFAGNWLLISPERLKQDGWLTKRQVPRAQVSASVRYPASHRIKRHAIGLAWENFNTTATPRQREEFAAFRQKTAGWVEDYGLYMAIKDRYRGAAWYAWPKDLARRNPAAIRAFTSKHSDEVDYFIFGQWLFDQQWRNLCRYANRRGVRILGDLPFGVARDSVDVWSNRSLFHVDLNGVPARTMGAPPDRFNLQGQNWATPTYRWSLMERRGHSWWLGRIERSLELYDYLRFDHFLGFQRTWEIDHEGVGRWSVHAGEKLLNRIRTRWPKRVLVAEDLGAVNEQVHYWRKRFGFLSSRVALFGIVYDRRHLHHPSSYTADSVAYSSLHDLPPICGWFDRLPKDGQHRVLRYLQTTSRHQLHWQMIQKLLQSKSIVSIIQCADVLGLDESARINRPGTMKGNWRWRLSSQLFPVSVRRKLRQVSRATRRV